MAFSANLTACDRTRSNESTGGHATDFDHVYNVTPQEHHLANIVPTQATLFPLPVDQVLPEGTLQARSQFPHQMDLNLLSAENCNEVYEEAPDSVEANGPRAQGFGGLLIMDRQPSPPQTRTRTRKGSKKDATKASSPEESARQRGRPRLDTKDLTPAERRRTQIRLAQRAYRQRKETTISGLNKRVSSLEQTIRDMHKTFSEFQDEAVAAGLRNWNPALAGSLHRSAVNFAEMAKNGIHESDGDEEDLEANQAGEAAAGVGGDILSSRDMRPLLAKHESDPGQRIRQPGADAGLGTNAVWGYSPTFQNLIVAGDQPDEQQDPVQDVEDASMQDWDDPSAIISQSNQNFQLYQVQVPESSAVGDGPSFADPATFFPMPSFLYSGLPLPTTFTNTEKSFARRLVRRSLEAAIQLLSSPSSTSEEINRFCRFTFCYSNRSRILECLKKMIARNADQNLEFWQTPFWHQGGSGLHFPRVGIDASSQPPKHWADPGPVGPTFQYTPENTHWDGLEKARVVQELGVDGEWFDSNDVEQYLRTKGIYLNGQSSIVEIIAEPDDVPGLGGTAPTTAASPSMTHSSPRSPLNDFVPTNVGVYGTEDIFSTDSISYDDAVPDVEVDSILTQSFPADTSSGTGNTKTPAAPYPLPDFDFNLFPQMNQMLLPQPPQAQLPDPQGEQEQPSYFTLKTKRYVDVERLIDSIVPQGVCLGRTPGFRRAHVDDALRRATTEGLGEMVAA